MANQFLKTVNQRPLLLDGGIGTLLYNRGVPHESCFEQLNIGDREKIQQLHIDYINAGADIIETNSFSGNRFKLASFGLDKSVWELNVWAAKIARNAREIAGQPVFIAGAVGPTGCWLPPVGENSLEELFDAYKEQMEALLAGGCDLFMLETMPSIEELAIAVKAAREISKLPVVAQLSFSPEGNSLMGSSPEDIVRMFDKLDVAPPEIIGINCGAGPGPVFDSLLRMKAAMEKSEHGKKLRGFSCLPNAGQPSLTGGRYLFTSRPDYCASYVEPYVRAGARLIGGCCGTTPEHISEMRKSLDAYIRATSKNRSSATLQDLPAQQPGTTAIISRASVSSDRLPAIELDRDLSDSSSETGVIEVFQAPTKIIPDASHCVKDRLATIKKDGVETDFFISVELDPPKGPVTNKLLRASKALLESGADAINVGDSPMARVRMSSLAACKLIASQAGIDTIIHFTTRDRNLMGIQADLLGCQALGVNTVLALTGDPPSLGNYAHATAVYDVDSIGLIKIISQLNEGRDMAGNTIGKATNLSIGCALNCTHENRKQELERFKRKIDAGAHFVMTQPIYQVSDLTNFLEDFGDCPIPILIGIMPLHSAKHAEYLHNEVPGISIPEDIRQTMARAGDGGAMVGLELAVELLERLKELCQGAYLVPSFGRYEDICTLVSRLKKGES